MFTIQILIINILPDLDKILLDLDKILPDLDKITGVKILEQNLVRSYKNSKHLVRSDKILIRCFSWEAWYPRHAWDMFWTVLGPLYMYRVYMETRPYRRVLVSLL